MFLLVLTKHCKRVCLFGTSFDLSVIYSNREINLLSFVSYIYNTNLNHKYYENKIFIISSNSNELV